MRQKPSLSGDRKIVGGPQPRLCPQRVLAGSGWSAEMALRISTAATDWSRRFRLVEAWNGHWPGGEFSGALVFRFLEIKSVGACRATQDAPRPKPLSGRSRMRLKSPSRTGSLQPEQQDIRFCASIVRDGPSDGIFTSRPDIMDRHGSAGVRKRRRLPPDRITANRMILKINLTMRWGHDWRRSKPRLQLEIDTIINALRQIQTGVVLRRLFTRSTLKSPLPSSLRAMSSRS